MSEIVVAGMDGQSIDQASHVDKQSTKHYHIMMIGFETAEIEAIKALFQEYTLGIKLDSILDKAQFQNGLQYGAWDLLLFRETHNSVIKFQYVAAHKEQLMACDFLYVCEALPSIERHVSILEAGFQMAWTRGDAGLLMTQIKNALLKPALSLASAQPANIISAPAKQTEEHANPPTHQLLSLSAFNTLLTQTITQAKSGEMDAALLLMHITTSEPLSSSEKDSCFDHAVKQINQHTMNTLGIGKVDQDRVAVLISAPHADTAARLAHKFCELESAMALTGHKEPVAIHLSIGIAMLNRYTANQQQAFKQAEHAVQSLWKLGKRGSAFQLYRDEKPLVDFVSSSRVVQQIIDSINTNRFQCLYQPIVPLCAQPDYCNYEIFLRLLTAEGDEVAPSVFMENIDDPKLLARVDLWVLEDAMRILKDSMNSRKPCRLFVSLAAYTLFNTSLKFWINEQLTALSIPANRIVFQVDEKNALAAPDQAKRFFKDIRELGCDVCLKHYSGREQVVYFLQASEISMVKLDGAMMSNLTQQGITSAAVTNYLAPLVEKEVSIIAPMVVNTRQMRDYFALGVHLVQGHYLQPPRHKMDYEFF